jgi:hypothetical protein
MTDVLHTQFKASLKWTNCIRKRFPTLVFYFTQTYDQTVVIYYRDATGTIQSVYTDLTVEAIGKCCSSPLPPEVHPHFQLLSVGTTTFKLPGIQSQTPWTLTTDGKLVHGDHMLVASTGVFNKETQELECIYLIYVDKVKRQLEWTRMECTAEMKTIVSEFKNILWTKLKSVIGGSK